MTRTYQLSNRKHCPEGKDHQALPIVSLSRWLAALRRIPAIFLPIHGTFPAATLHSADFQTPGVRSISIRSAFIDGFLVSTCLLPVSRQHGRRLTNLLRPENGGRILAVTVRNERTKKNLGQGCGISLGIHAVRTTRTPGTEDPPIGCLGAGVGWLPRRGKILAEKKRARREGRGGRERGTPGGLGRAR